MDSMANPNDARLEMPRPRSRSRALDSLSIHSYLPLAAFYFFFNNAGLPYGLFYTTLFSPFLFLWLYLKGRRWLTTKFLLVLSPFILAHIVLGIESPPQYLRTLLHWWTVYVAVYAICLALTKCRSVDRLFEQLILLNFCAMILALACFRTPLRPFFWLDDSGSLVSGSIAVRLQLLSTEPSAYAELMLPLLVFAVLRLLRDSKRRNAVYLMMIVLPFLLCQSFGGISIGLAGIGVSLMTGYRQLLRRQRSRILFLCLAIATGTLLLTPNPISERVWQVVSGGDSSSNVRTVYSFTAAYSAAASKSLWWGVGLGQVKYSDFSDLHLGGMINGLIPNAMAGTFAEFGFIGILVVLAVEFYLFFKTTVYRNSFRLAMFVVASINQFTGSYGSDVQQYLIWFLAFYSFFPKFNLRSDLSSKVSHP